jgi:hypothetical protein
MKGKDMTYVSPDYKTKKEFKQAVKDGVRHFTYINGSPLKSTQNGQDVIEGPHYPKPHTWYAEVTVVDGRVTKIKS